MKIFTPLIALLFLTAALSAQTTSTTLRVYRIFQEKCIQCHDHASPEAGLDLEEEGVTEATRAFKVRSNLFNVTPANQASAAKGHKYLYPGRVDKSLLFRKINQGLEPTLGLDAGENQSMPPYGQPQLDDVEKELIRQWILFGAPLNSMVVQEELLEEFYSGNAQLAFPDGPPPAPAAGEGFQIKMGPFYLEPGGEIEYYQKHELDLPTDVEVNRVDVQIGTYSHHFILYDFNPGGGNNIPPGLRLNANHSDIGLVAAVQESTDLKLPQGTAFPWDKQLVLDLNSHYINYSSTNVYQAETYVNIYTQPAGTAAQEMKTELIANLNIPIPNNGSPVTHTQQLDFNLGEVFVWGLMGHTHKYGTGYKIYKRLPGGQQGELIYDAACAQGIPGCVSPFFDYQHIPMRYYLPLEPITFNASNGLIHQASWVNDGPQPVGWGPTSDDEMMVMIIMYTEDTVGVVTDIREVQPLVNDVLAYPNPAQEEIAFSLPATAGEVRLRLHDATGKVVRQQSGLSAPDFIVRREGLPSGLYFYHLEGEDGRVRTGKVVFR
ncbi:MAG: T9SS type A sorting domain-containing protein [Lewinellaceae bacterium]|nr:T9SS type A sorting domain-containing protein [Phaeodactylibacter sp.]MCB9039107.1 T9SS type A sorting domain-containing protein [Lewinellaceae bacterium]